MVYTHLRIHAWYIWAMVCQSQHEVKTITVCQAFIMNSDEREARFRRKRERRAAESSEERETRLAKRRVADRATNSNGGTERRRERRRERRAAESSEQRETRSAWCGG